MKRVLAVLAAVVLALVGGGAVLAYAKASDARALAGQQATEVYVSTTDIPAGTTAAAAVDQGLLKLTYFAAKSVPDGALVEVTDDMADKVAVSDIAPGEMVLAKRFGEQRQGQAALVVPEGLVAVTVQMSDPGRVGPFLRPSSKIAVYNTFTARDPDAGDYTPVGVGLAGAEDSVNATRILLPTAEVLAVGDVTLSGRSGPAGADQKDRAPEAGTEKVPTALVTVAVTAYDAQRLVHAAQTGTLYAGLLGEGADAGSVTVDDRQLFVASP